VSRWGRIFGSSTLAAVCAVATGCGSSSASPNSDNPGVKALVVTLTEWGQCLVDAGENLHQTLADVRGTGVSGGIQLSFASGDRFLVTRPASTSAVATAADSQARSHLASGLARDPVCHTTRAFPGQTVSELVRTYMHIAP